MHLIPVPKAMGVVVPDVVPVVVPVVNFVVVLVVKSDVVPVVVPVVVILLVPVVVPVVLMVVVGQFDESTQGTINSSRWIIPSPPQTPLQNITWASGLKSVDEHGVHASTSAAKKKGADGALHRQLTAVPSTRGVVVPVVVADVEAVEVPVVVPVVEPVVVMVVEGHASSGRHRCRKSSPILTENFSIHAALHKA